MIRLENISKIYDAKIDTTKALDNVSLQINDGELVAIMGPSGSGKSTLLNILGCMDTATEGKYYVDDVEVSMLKKSQRDSFRKKNIGFVFQHFALMDYYTAYENIELPLIANNVRKSERKKIVQQQLEHLGITSQRNKLPKKMSGGQQQRVAIARALDQKTGQEVLALLKEINSTGKTVIIVTHDEKIAADCNRVIMIQDGRIRDDKKIVS